MHTYEYLSVLFMLCNVLKCTRMMWCDVMWCDVMWCGMYSCRKCLYMTWWRMKWYFKRITLIQLPGTLTWRWVESLESLDLIHLNVTHTHTHTNEKCVRYVSGKTCTSTSTTHTRTHNLPVHSNFFHVITSFNANFLFSDKVLYDHVRHCVTMCITVLIQPVQSKHTCTCTWTRLEGCKDKDQKTVVLFVVFLLVFILSFI